ncbi:SPW repeat domain-containing protein [Mucilaginibacter arboris]|uniref:SPW repeat-containing integral membrane domain-containing protein n=1 Tax=Mucilaginibacter arboris TaxID=2682090 RepID=A0A7K1SW10_9SPHI|nr:SPW repeat protein [Mucilaginibacter arboris]MVN21427.1 hypothetical protein [Mucilaginibacter arboris]
MERFISRKGHGFIEAGYIPVTALAPELFGFEEEQTAKLLCRIQAGSALVSDLLTKAEWGLFKIIPFKTHLAIDVAMGAFSLAAPWLFGFSKNTKACNTFLAMGAAGIVAGLLTEPKEILVYKS